MMRDEGDCEQTNDMTLTGRVARIERILAPLGLEEFEGNLNRARREKEAAAQGYAGEDCQSQKPRTALEEIAHRIGTALENVHYIGQRLESIGNRTMGVLPEAGLGSGAAEKIREPDGTLEAAFRMLDYLDGGIEHLRARAVRLEGL